MVAGRTRLLRVGAVAGIAAAGADNFAVDLLHPLAAALADVRLLARLGIVHVGDYLCRTVCIYLSVSPLSYTLLALAAQHILSAQRPLVNP